MYDIIVHILPQDADVMVINLEIKYLPFSLSITWQPYNGSVRSVNLILLLRIGASCFSIFVAEKTLFTAL